MIKKITFKRLALTILLLLLFLILYNYPEEINEDIKIDINKKAPIYLIDESNFVALSSIDDNSNNVSELIEDIISSLTIGGKELKEGFKAIIPKDTKLLDYELKDGLLKVNFSKEILNIDEDNEDKMISAIVYSLLEIDNIEKIMIFVDGERLMYLPHSKKRLDLYLDRSYGVNRIIDIEGIKNTQMTTIYYLAKNNNDYYYIPVSLITNKEEDKIKIIINRLKTNTLNSSNLLSHINYQVELMNYEINEQEIKLNFNNILLNIVNNGKLEEEVKYAISYSIRDSLNINNIIFMVDNVFVDQFKATKKDS